MIKTPILYSHADTDPINDYKGTLEAFELTPSTDKEIKNWPGLFHECKSFLFYITLFQFYLFTFYYYVLVHNETMPQRQEITEYYVNWMKKRIPPVKI